MSEDISAAKNIEKPLLFVKLLMNDAVLVPSEDSFQKGEKYKISDLCR